MPDAPEDVAGELGERGPVAGFPSSGGADPRNHHMFPSCGHRPCTCTLGSRFGIGVLPPLFVGPSSPNCIDWWRWATYPASPYTDMSPRRTVPLSDPCSLLCGAGATRTPGTTSWQQAVIRTPNAAQPPPPSPLSPTHPHPNKFRQCPFARRVWKRSHWKREFLEGPLFRF